MSFQRSIFAGPANKWPSSGWSPMFIGIGVCIGVLGVFMTADPACRHWFVAPVLLCGCLISRDAFDWLLGKRDLLDPVGIVGAFGLYFFFLTPLLHVTTGYWMLYVTPPDDWRPWLGLAAMLNCVGIMFYHTIVRRGGRPKPHIGSVWLLREGRFWIVLAFAAIISLVAEAYITVSFGGFSGQLDSYMRSLSSHKDLLANMGWIVALSESFPVLMMLGILVQLRKCRRPPGILSCVCIFGVFIGLQILFGGYRVLAVGGLSFGVSI